MQPFISLSLAILSCIIVVHKCFADDCGDSCPAASIVSDSTTGVADTCSATLLGALEPFENPIIDDECKLNRFELLDGSFGPSPIPGLGVLERDQMFSSNIMAHRKEAALLFKVFLSCKTFDDFKNAAFYYKSLVNPIMYTYVFSAALINRRDTDTFSIPSLHQILPSHFLQSKAIEKGRKKIKRQRRKHLRKFEKRKRSFKRSIGRKGGIKGRHSQQFHHKHEKSEGGHRGEKGEGGHRGEKGEGRHRGKRQAQSLDLAPPNDEPEIIQMPLDKTGDNRDPEHRLVYFREDIGINSHHWHWHLVYPVFWWNGPNNIIKDRKGELFFYMHNQIVKRYNGARLAAGLDWVEPLQIQLSGTIVKEGYFPHLFSNTIGAEFTGRPRNLLMQNITNHPQAGTHNLADLLQWYNTVKDAINAGFVVTDGDGSQLALDEKLGIDILGAAVEASSWTPNGDLYGDIHNTGHVLLSYIHDPTGEFHASQGVMGFTETALRDPVFWRWHKMIDNLFNLHKAILPPYDTQTLTWSDVQITSVSMTSTSRSSRTFKPNECATYFRTRILDVSRGLDFEAEDDSTRVNITHLDHLPFTYSIQVNNANQGNLEGHVRIFIAPQNGPDGHALTDEEQRQNSIEMDRFTVELQPGKNTLKRFSQESAVTMTPGRQWAQLSKSDVEFKPSDDNDNFCGCGWPDHLLLPTGTTQGIKYNLFIMISNWSKEKIGDTETYRTCDDSLTMCGLLDKKFPDSRSMGFPLDRPILTNDWFLRPNMIRQPITIYHMDDYSPL